METVFKEDYGDGRWGYEMKARKEERIMVYTTVILSVVFVAGVAVCAYFGIQIIG